jgi:Flp pilus assembly protein TadD
MFKVIARLLVMLATLSSVTQLASAQPSAYAQAEALNDEGKALIGRVDLAGAAAKFRQAIALVEDPRYVFNLCYALEKSGVLQEARRECQWVTTSR